MRVLLIEVFDILGIECVDDYSFVFQLFEEVRIMNYGLKFDLKRFYGDLRENSLSYKIYQL